MSLELAPGEPMMSRDNLDSMKSPAVASGPMAPELGIEPASIEVIAPMYLTGASSRTRFNTFRASAGR
jgi:NADH dehydrogenase